MGGWVAFPCHDEVSCHTLVDILYLSHINLRGWVKGHGESQPLAGEELEGHAQECSTWIREGLERHC